MTRQNQPPCLTERTMPVTLTETLREYIAACFTGLWIESHEHSDAILEIAQLCRDEDWRLAVWDVERGLQVSGETTDDAGAADPLAAVRSVNALADPDASVVLVLKNFHRFLNSPEVIQAVAEQVLDGRQNRTFLIVLSPVVSLPIELEKLFTVVTRFPSSPVFINVSTYFGAGCSNGYSFGFILSFNRRTS